MVPLYLPASLHSYFSLCPYLVLLLSGPLSFSFIAVTVHLIFWYIDIDFTIVSSHNFCSKWLFFIESPSPPWFSLFFLQHLFHNVIPCGIVNRSYSNVWSLLYYMVSRNQSSLGPSIDCPIWPSLTRFSVWKSQWKNIYTYTIISNFGEAIKQTHNIAHICPNRILQIIYPLVQSAQF